MSYKLSINTGFAVNRYAEPDQWIKVIGKELNLRFAQITADILNPSLSNKIIKNEIKSIKKNCKIYDLKINSFFTGTFTRVNHLAHPNKDIQKFWINWFKRLIDISLEIDCKIIGSHFGILTKKDDSNKISRENRVKQNIENWHNIARYANRRGIEHIAWEPMSIRREQGETIKNCKILHKKVNNNAPIKFKICLDVDHGDISSTNPKDINPYEWLKMFAKQSSMIHLKQSFLNKSSHYPFTKEYNKRGCIVASKVLKILNEKQNTNAELILEHSFKEREPYDSNVIKILKESVDYWKIALRK